MGQIADVIKYEGDNSTFVWKHPSEDFNSLTQLIVHESQEAIFFMNGQALDLFGPGRYTLETQNIPKIGKFLNRNTGDVTPFHSEVYFINQSVQMGLKWGTDSKVRYIDPDSGIPLELGASGEMNMQVCDSRKLLVKLVGTMKGIAWGDTGTGFTKSLQTSFRPLINMAVNSNLSAAIKEKEINVLEVDEHLSELAETLADKIRPGFEEYGLAIPQFNLTTVLLPEDDPNFRRLKELQTITLQTRMICAESTVRTAQAQAEADVAAARRQVELEKQLTETEVAKQIRAAEAEKKRKRNKIIAMIATPIVACLIAFIIILNTVIIPTSNYNKAMNLMEAGKYTEAIEAFEDLNGYKDSEAQIEKCSTAIKDQKYDAALALYNAGKYTEAIEAFEDLNGYKDSDTKITEIKAKPDYLFKNAKVGSTIVFGSYEQDNNKSNGKEEIEWQVLAKEGNKILVISKYALDCQKYNSTYTSVTWETCSLRTWLNGTFYNAAFSSSEQEKIVTTKVSADKNPSYSTNPGNASNDNVFLLSITEVNKYFSSNDEKKCIPTAYAIAQGAYTDSSYTVGGKATCWWWLRSPGYSQHSAAYVTYDGSVFYYGSYVYYEHAAVRPALWIDLAS